MVQSSRAGANPIPWRIDSGPDSLAPGQSGLYQVSARANSRYWSIYDDAQVVVVDAGENQSLRGMAMLPLDRTLLWPDAIANTSYQFWTEDKSSPLFWYAQSFPDASGSVSMVSKAGQEALALTADPKGSALGIIFIGTQMSFPVRPFGVWLYSDSAVKGSPTAAYGIEISDDQHVMRYQVGNLSTDPSSTTAQHIEHLSLPPNQWSYVEIDPQAIYARAGWQLPPLQNTSYRGVNTDVRLLNMRFFAAASSGKGRFDAYFRPVQQADYGPAPETLMDETFKDPAEYYTRLGDIYLKQANYSRAIEAYQQALGFSPDDAIANKLKQAQDDQQQHLQ
jgi:hypothetical protein